VVQVWGAANVLFGSRFELKLCGVLGLIEEEGRGMLKR
jgi:hypothetical protein